MASSNGYNTGGLRSDARQWLIYDDEALGALIRGLEAFAMHMAAGPLLRHRVAAVRGMAMLMRRVANHRIAEMQKADGAQRVVVRNLTLIFEWLGYQQQGILLPAPTDALDEIHATSTRLDSRAHSAGVGSPVGTHRRAVRGD